jgi:hypothetical protein
VSPASEIAARRRARTRRNPGQRVSPREPDTEPDAQPDVAPGTHLDPLDELDIALYAISDFGQSIPNADTKSGMLGALLGLLLAGVTSQQDLIRDTVTSPHDRWAAGVLVTFVVSLVFAGGFLGLTQLPRLSTPLNVRRLAFPAAARRGGVRSRMSAAELRDEAWSQAETLARIALRKFRYLRWSLLSSGFCVLLFLVWLGLSAVPAGPR